jgi:hypothetical protein
MASDIAGPSGNKYFLHVIPLALISIQISSILLNSNGIGEQKRREFDQSGLFNHRAAHPQPIPFSNKGTQNSK